MINFKRRAALIFALLVSVFTVAGLATTGAAKADPVGIGVVQNTQGEAGYYANSNGHTRFRYVQAQVGVTNQIKFLNGITEGNLGAVGVELCNPNTDYSIQLGVLWNPGSGHFEVQYGYGLLGAPIGGNDPCVQSGLLNGLTSHLQFLNNFTPAAGDQLTFAIYYNPRSHWVTVNSCDLTQDSCRTQSFYVGWQNFYEFGIGAITQELNLTAPALNQLVVFTHTAANYYSATHPWNSIFVPAHWNLKRADFINGSSQVVMSSNGGLNGSGTAFPLLNGSTSP